MADRIPNYNPGHILDIESLDRAQLEALLASAQDMAADPYGQRHRCAGRLLVNLFYEPSTRTRVSFEIAGKRLGMDVVNVAASGSSVVKGEGLADTYRTLLAMDPDVVVLRHPDRGVHARLAGLDGHPARLVNAGDGSRAHPTQALLDALTLKRHFDDLSKITVLVAGDLRHSRVTRSGAVLLKKLGVGELRLASPSGLKPGPNVSEGAVLFDDLDAALAGADAVMMLRVQKERMDGMDVPDHQSYHHDWGLTPERLALAAPGCIVMHPGPMNRGVEIAPEVADGPQSVILEQVRNGVAVRMAVLDALTR